MRLFADDCIIYRRIDSGEDIFILQNDLNSIYSWAIINKMKINAVKSKSLSFSKSAKKVSLNYNMGGVAIPQVSCCKYLGVILRQDLGWGEHVTSIAEKRGSHYTL